MHSHVSGLTPMHPGELLREDILPALNRSKAEIAKLIEMSRQTLYDFLAEKQDVTPDYGVSDRKAYRHLAQYVEQHAAQLRPACAGVKDADIIARILTIAAA